MLIDKNIIKKNLMKELCLKQSTLYDKLFDEYVDEICDLSVNIVTALSETDTKYLRTRLGLYNNGEIQPYRVIADSSNNLAQNICVAMHKIYNNMRNRIISGSVNNRDDMSKMSSLMLNPQYRNTDISKLNLNSRIRRVLNNRVNTIYDLLSCGYDDLERLGLGIESIKVLIDKIHEFNLKIIDELTDEERKIIISMSSNEKINNSSLSWIKNIDRMVVRNISPNRNIGNLKKYYLSTGVLSNDALDDAKKVGIDLGKFKMSAIDIINSRMSFEELLELPLINVDFSLRIYNALNRWGLKTIGDIVKLNVKEIRKIRGINEVGIDEITDLIHSIGLNFRNENTKLNIYAIRIYKRLDELASFDDNKKKELITTYKLLSEVKENLEDMSLKINSEIIEKMKDENSKKKVKSSNKN